MQNGFSVSFQPLKDRQVNKIVGVKRHTNTRNLKEVLVQFHDIEGTIAVDYFQFTRTFPDLLDRYLTDNMENSVLPNHDNTHDSSDDEDDS